MSETTRFAPSPSGHLHLGHAFSALFAQEQAGGGRFLLRIEDIDSGRCRPGYEAALLEDLAWLGLVWEEPPRRQSDHLADYAAALERLNAAGLIYPCFCTRREIAQEIARSASAPQGPDGPLYPGICRALSKAERRARLAAGARPALRLEMAKAARVAGPLFWQDAGEGRIQAKPEAFGDVVLARRDIGASYHLAVTLDDAVQGISLVTRGRDLFEATHVHRLLQALLDLPVPRWHHHALVTDEAGRRLAKRDDARSLRGLRAEGVTPGEVRARLKSACGTVGN